MIHCKKSTSGYIPDENEIILSDRYLLPYVHCSIVYNGQDMGHCECALTGQQIKTTWSMHIWSKMLFSHKNEENSAISRNMHGP